MDLNHLIYSKVTAARIFGKQAQAIELDRDRAVVTFTDGTSAIASTAQFKQQFAENRRQAGKAITDVKQINEFTYRVKGQYTVSVFPDALECDCQDWHNQLEVGINRPTCKHCYAVLNQLGCTSLAEFVKTQEAPSTPSKAKKESPELFPVPKKSNTEYSVVWKIVFETYAMDPDEEHPVPIDTAEFVLERKPTPKEITQLRWDAHKQGYKLVAVESQKRYHHDEF